MKHLLMLALILLLAACGSDEPGGDTVAPEPDDTSTTVDGGSEGETTTTLPERVDPSRVTVPETTPPVVGEVPQDILDEILADASERAGVPVDDFTVRRSEATTWSDGSLGCPQPGEAYTQAIVDGYWVELVAPDGTVLDYRVGDSGYFKLCEGSPTPHSGGSTGGESGTNPDS
jgi:hypothetical protein